MGAGQSSDTSSAAAVEIKTSYYELLGVARLATEEEIKKAYRRKALELHPDRNYGNEEAATRTFAEIQAAYEVLSDPQERAWYDSHESAILRGEDGAEGGDQAPMYENIRITTADDLARLVRKFNSNIEFSDAPSGFFGFVRETFEKLAKEEEVAANWENLEPRDYPTFGHKDDSYGDVVKTFYAAWSSFSTVKTFAWRDKYRLSEAPDRWYRRRMEQENKAVRQEARKEFNEAVRSLVAFIRKRDPRHVVSTQTEAERQQALRNAAAAQAARARANNLANLQGEVAEWTKIREPEELEDEEDDEEEEEEQEILECVACSKTFKSERQWEAHEKSKKHQKAIHALQRKMRKENACLDLKDEDISSGLVTPAVEDEEEEQEVIADTDGEIEDNEARTNGAHDNVGDDTSDPEDESEKGTNLSRTTDDHKSGDAKHSESAEQSDASENSDYASPSTIAARLHDTTIEPSAATTSPNVASAQINGDDGPNLDESDTTSQPTRKMGKAAQKRAKKAAAAAATESEHDETSHKCATCNAAFPSRTRLFQHIKDHNHAALKPASDSQRSSAKKKKGKR